MIELVAALLLLIVVFVAVALPRGPGIHKFERPSGPRPAPTRGQDR